MVGAEFSSGPNLIDDNAIGALTGIKNNIPTSTYLEHQSQIMY